MIELWPEWRMLPSQALEPSALSGDLGPGPWWVLAPHADDETFGLGGTLALALDQGIAVHVMVLTDGALGVPDTASDPVARKVVGANADRSVVGVGDSLVGQRECETWAALAVLARGGGRGGERRDERDRHDGMESPVDSVHSMGAGARRDSGVPPLRQQLTVEFLRAPDRGLETVLDAALLALQRWACGGTVFFPAPWEAHPDHRMAAVLGWRLWTVDHARRPVAACSYEISSQMPVCNRLVAIDDVIERKRAAMACYHSQSLAQPYAERVLALNSSRAWSLGGATRYAEAFFCWPEAWAGVARLPLTAGIDEALGGAGSIAGRRRADADLGDTAETDGGDSVGPAARDAGARECEAARRGDERRMGALSLGEAMAAVLLERLMPGVLGPEGGLPPAVEAPHGVQPGAASRAAAAGSTAVADEAAGAGATACKRCGGDGLPTVDKVDAGGVCKLGRFTTAPGLTVAPGLAFETLADLARAGQGPASRFAPGAVRGGAAADVVADAVGRGTAAEVGDDVAAARGEVAAVEVALPRRLGLGMGLRKSPVDQPAVTMERDVTNGLDEARWGFWARMRGRLMTVMRAWPEARRRHGSRRAVLLKFWQVLRRSGLSGVRERTRGLAFSASQMPPNLSLSGQLPPRVDGGEERGLAGGPQAGPWREQWQKDFALARARGPGWRPDVLRGVGQHQATAARGGAVATRIRALAYFLPQFHPIAENDEWWGAGFTEWTNVAKARPQFVGHEQPKLPADFGFYDLRLPEVMAAQIELARRYGLHGFCFYYYWFSGRRLLERPLDQFLADSERFDFPFCLCWANENWTRRWDGAEHEMLLAQSYAPDDPERFIADLEPALRDPRYIRIDGRPLLLVYRIDALKNPVEVVQRWRAEAARRGLPELYLAAVQSFEIEDPRPYGCDAAVEFPPHKLHLPQVREQLPMLNPENEGLFFAYSSAKAFALARPAPVEQPFRWFRGVMPAWDNEARKPGRGHVFVNSTPGLYAEWLHEVVQQTDAAAAADDERIVFINAWNEWGEGAYLEPDRRWGHAYLEATAEVLEKFPLRS
ncbi:MAG: glycoside hydrolase family 99-like domain-containing protein [Thioalkalivibrionaceae bacterium]